MSVRAFYLLVYDIPDDKRRTRLAKRLKASGERVQYSVFEAYLNAAELQRLLVQVKRLLDEDEDSLRIYNLCQACRGNVTIVGKGEVTEKPGLMIV